MAFSIDRNLFSILLSCDLNKTFQGKTFNFKLICLTKCAFIFSMISQTKHKSSKKGNKRKYNSQYKFNICCLFTSPIKSDAKLV
jgi:hypothetical protein